MIVVIPRANQTQALDAAMTLVFYLVERRRRQFTCFVSRR